MTYESVNAARAAWSRENEPRVITEVTDGGSTTIYLDGAPESNWAPPVLEWLVFDHTVEYGRRRFWLFGPRKRRPMTTAEVLALREQVAEYLERKWFPTREEQR